MAIVLNEGLSDAKKPVLGFSIELKVMLLSSTLLWALGRQLGVSVRTHNVQLLHWKRGSVDKGLLEE